MAHSKYRYVFSFPEPTPLHLYSVSILYGNSIREFWNETADGFDWHARMVVERLDGNEFTLEEVRSLFNDLVENVTSDSPYVVGLEFRSLKKIECLNYRDSYSQDFYEMGEEDEKENADEESDADLLEEESDGIMDYVLDISYNYFEEAAEQFKTLKLIKITQGFNLKNKALLLGPEHSELRYCLERFREFRDNRIDNFHRLYNIIQKLKKSGLYQNVLDIQGLQPMDVNTVSKILNDNTIVGSRHENEGNKIKLRQIKPEELQLCESVVKSLISGWLRVKCLSRTRRS